jgi:DNA-binding transcriptional LysR family regulator
VQLTEAGRLLLNEARDILARVDRATVVARRGGDSEAGRLRVGIGYCMDLTRITAAVSAFNARRDATQVELHTLPVPLQLAMLRDERLDLGFVRPPVTDAALRSEILAGEPLVVALPVRHRLAAKDDIPLSALASESFILVPRNSVPILHDIVVKACRDAGFIPHAPHEADHLELLLGMVAGGRGVALVPACARTTTRQRVVCRSLRSPAPLLETALAWRRENASPLLNEFVAIARRIFARAQRQSRRSSTSR